MFKGRGLELLRSVKPGALSPLDSQLAQTNRPPREQADPSSAHSGGTAEHWEAIHAKTVKRLTAFVNGTLSLEGCTRFFFQRPRRGHPDRYCSPEHATEANELAAARRAKDYRERQAAIRVLSKRYPSRARALVTAVKKPGLSAEELVRRAEAEGVVQKTEEAEMKAAIHSRFSTDRRNESSIRTKIGFVLAGALVAVLSRPACAQIVTTEQQCKEGNATACRLLELAKRIDFRRFDSGSEYELAAGPHAQWSIVAAMPRSKDQTRLQIKAAACTFYNEVWLDDPLVQEYERLGDVRVVSRAGYNLCMELLR